MASDPLSWLQQLLGGGQGAPQQSGGGIGALFDAISGSPTIQAMRAPNAGAIDLSAATGLPSAMESMLGAERAYDPTRSFAANALDPRSIEQAMNIAMSTGPGALKYTLQPFRDPAQGMWQVKSPRGEDLGEIARYIETNPRTGDVQTSYGHSMQTDVPYFSTVEDAAMDLRKAYAEMLRRERRFKGLLD